MSGARNTDPPTSWLASGPDKGGRPSLRYRQLLSYWAADLRGDDGLTNDEAALDAGIEINSRICYWKRTSELLQWGAVATVYDANGSSVKRPGMSFTGELQEVHAITFFGRRAVSDPSLIRGDWFEKTSAIGRQVMCCDTLDQVAALWVFHALNKTLTKDVVRVLKRRERQLKRRKRP